MSEKHVVHGVIELHVTIEVEAKSVRRAEGEAQYQLESVGWRLEQVAGKHCKVKKSKAWVKEVEVDDE